MSFWNDNSAYGLFVFDECNGAVYSFISTVGVCGDAPSDKVVVRCMFLAGDVGKDFLGVAQIVECCNGSEKEYFIDNVSLLDGPAKVSSCPVNIAEVKSSVFLVDVGALE